MAEDNVQIWDGIDQSEDFEFDEEGVSESYEAESESEEDEEDLPVEFGIDFETGQLTGGKVSGLDAIKVWAWNALKTPRYIYEQFGWDYGSELEDLIGMSQMPFEYIESEAKRMIEECLTQNRFIEGIRNFSCSMSRDTLQCSFNIITTLGEVEYDVTV